MNGGWWGGGGGGVIKKLSMYACREQKLFTDVCSRISFQISVILRQIA